tara:strand:- start:115 stop:1392 length:1278 start_codon:yes stop_codon:yes gene_type:complete
MDDVHRRVPGAFMGNARAQEALSVGSAQQIGQKEAALDAAHTGAVAQAIARASQAEGKAALQSERLEDMRAVADDWRPKVARVGAAVAPALAMGAMAYEHYNSPEQKALRAAKAATPDSSMPMPGDMNPQDLATLQDMHRTLEARAQPMQADPSVNVTDQIDAEMARVGAHMNTLSAAKAAMNDPAAQTAQIFDDAARFGRQRKLMAANTPEAHRLRRAANLPQFDTMPTQAQMHPDDLESLQSMSKPRQADPSVNVTDQIGAEVDRVNSYLDTLNAARSAMNDPTAQTAQIFDDAARFGRQRKLQAANTPEAQRMRRATHTPQFDAMPTEAQMNPADLEELKFLSQDHGPIEPFDEGRLADTMQFIEHLEALKAGGAMPQSFALDELYRDRAREKRRQLLESGAVRGMRRGLANMPANPYLEGY